ncbi:MAG: transglutaminase family protein [Mailhella sp.]|nr:transglutaminase family protein [Mailhella sp.]
MKRFAYRFEYAIEFATAVTNHAYHLRPLPREEQFQRIIEENFCLEAVLPNGSAAPVRPQQGMDAFGGKVLYGSIGMAHTSLRAVAEGIVAQRPYRICGTAHGMYHACTPLTTPSDKMLAFAHALAVKHSTADTGKYARAIADAVHAHMVYLPGSTDVATTAAQSFELGSGVCQDYAHITLALLRHAGIPARYVCGFLSGEGATHAWIEYFDSGVWFALDPTHGRAVEYGCVKIAHGRDSADCAVNRGVFTGRTEQRNRVSIRVEEL